tara:strand:- start:50 stop:451 length:402 start_codon:yes stop_codon:yes gene_type:complete
MIYRLYLIFICTFCITSFRVTAQQNSPNELQKESFTITLKCGEPDLSRVSMLLICEGKHLFLSARPGSTKNHDFLSTIDPSLIDSLIVSREKVLLAKYGAEEEKGIITLYLDSTFMDFSPKKIRSKFKYENHL